MSKEPIDPNQLDLFGENPAHRKAVEIYDWIRPVLRQERTLAEQSRHTGVAYRRLWRYWKRFQGRGFLGLIDGRTGVHRRGKAPIEEGLPDSVQQQVVRLAMAHPFTYRELARIVEACYGHSVDHHGIRRVLDLHHLSSKALKRHHHQTPPASPSLPIPPSPQLAFSLAPPALSLSQRLARAIGPEHLLVRFRTYREYPTEEHARWRIIELLDVGFRPRRIANLLAIDPHIVYRWHRRFKASGLVGLTTRTRESTSITTRVSMQAMMEVFELIDNNPLLGHYRVKMALDSLGYRYGHTTVWQMVTFYKHAHPEPKGRRRKHKHEERPKQAIRAHQVWFMDLRYLVKIEGRWLYSILIFDGYSRAIVGAGCAPRQNFAWIVRVFREAVAQWGAPDELVSDNAKVFVALDPCLQKLGIHGSPIKKGHPWQNLAESGFSIQRRMLDAYVVGCRDREEVYRQHDTFVRDYLFWGHWAHKRKDDQGRIYYLSPEVILGNAKGREIESARLQKILRLRQLTRTVRRHGQIRLHNFGIYVDRVLWGQTVDVLIYDDALRIEQKDQLIVSYPCGYDTKQRRITSVQEEGRQQHQHFEAIQLALFVLEIVRTVWRMPPYRWPRWPRRAVRAIQRSLFRRIPD